MIRLILAAALLTVSVAPAVAQTNVSDEKLETSIGPIGEQTDHLLISSTMGDGPPVVLIPGLATPSAVWRPLLRKVGPDHRVITVQVLGFAAGDIGANARPGMLEGIVDDLARYIRKREGKPPAIIGHSMGGLIGMMLAARHPDLVGSLMVVDALPFIGTLFDPGATAASMASQAAAMRDRIAEGPDPAASKPVTTDPGGIWSNTPAGRIQVANWSRMANPQVVAQATYETMRTDLRPKIDAITAKPFTVLYATGAGARATAIWERAYRGSSATLVPVADSYHFIMLDQPERFATAVEAFLEQSFPDAAAK